MTYGTRAWKLICKWYRSVLNHERMMGWMRQWGRWGQDIVAPPSHLEQLEPRLMLSGTPTIQVDAPTQADEGAPIQIDFAAVPETVTELDLSSSPTYSSYHQDRAGSQFEVWTNDGNYIKIYGDVWKKIDFPYTVTADTILEFEFKSTNEGQIHGIGFDVNNVINSGESAIQLFGTQNASSLIRAAVEDDIDEYAGTTAGWQSYRIHIGDYFTGTKSYMTFFAEDDGDGSGPNIGNADSWFRNIRVYEEVTATGWSVDWGDGGTPDSYAAGTTSATHTYAQDSTGEASGHYDLVVTASVAEGDLDSDPVEITVINIPPTVAIEAGSLPSAIYQGTEVTLGSTVTDPGADSLTYSWSVTKDGDPYTLTGITTNGTSLTFTPDGLGSYAVTLTVSDGVADPVSATHFLLLVDPDVVAESQTGIVIPEGTTCSLSVHSRPYGADPVDFSAVSFSSYGVGQDGQNGLPHTAEVAPAPDYDDMEVRIAGNAWKSIPFDYTVTADTMLEFRFKSTELGEIHGIGLDSDASHTTGKRLFEIYGNDTSGNFWKDDSWKYTDEDLEEYVLFRIPVGQYFTGQMNRLTFVCDDDVDQYPADPTAGLGDSWFKDVRVYERYDPESWTVDWGDGTPVVEPDGSVGAVSHTYTEDSDSDAYQIEVTAHFTQGDVSVPPIAITVTNAAPEVKIDGPREVTYGTQAGFTADASDPGTGDTLSYSWTVSCNGEPVSLEGIASDQETLTMTLSEVGTWEIWVTVDDGDGAQTSAKHYVTIPGVRVTSDQATVDEGDPYTIYFDFTPEGSAPVDVSATTHSSYHEDRTGSDWSLIVEDGWTDGVQITGDAWKKIDFPCTVTADTILEFEFKSTNEGQIHGIGFDVNNVINSGESAIQLFGTQNASSLIRAAVEDDIDEYAGTTAGWQSYRIHIGDYFTGTKSYMTFFAEDDGDGSTGNANSWFRNIRVYEKYDTTGWTVNWGDGTQESMGALADTGSHAYPNAGTYNIVVTRHSAADDVASPAMAVTVEEPVNALPIITTNIAGPVNEGDTLTVTSSFLETTDENDSPEVLTYTVTSLPAHGVLRLSDVDLQIGSTFTQQDINDCLLSYQHDGSEETADSFNFSVTDGEAEVPPTGTFSITVELTNDAPDLSVAGPSAWAEGVAGQFVITADDEENDSLTITARCPSWLTLVDNGDGTGTLSGTPSPAYVGENLVEVMVSDSVNPPVTKSYVITVKPPIGVSVDHADPCAAAGGTSVAAAEDLLIGLVPNTNIVGGSVRIDNYVAGEDVLAFTDTRAIAGSWNAGTGTLTLTGSALATDYEAALRSVTYQNTNATSPSIDTRMLSVAVTDDLGSTVSTTVAVDVQGPSLIVDAVLAAAARESLGLAWNATLGETELAQLTTLEADASDVQTLEGIQYAVNLELLRLIPTDYTRRPDFDATELNYLDALTCLRELALHGVGVDDAELPALDARSSLKTLDLRYNSITDLYDDTASTAYLDVAGFTGLESLALYGNPIADPDTPIENFSPIFGRLFDLDLSPRNLEKAKTYQEIVDAHYQLPLDIYEYVLNTIRPELYCGFMKGPQAVLETGAGNDADTASLLAELLSWVDIDGDERDSTTAPDDISARYIQGLAEIEAGTVTDYVGAMTTDAAILAIAYAGVNFLQPISIGGAEYFRFERIALQVELIPGSDNWVYMDPNWKFRDFQTGVQDILDLVPFDYRATDNAAYTDTYPTELNSLNFDDAYLSQVRDELPIEYYASLVRDYLAENMPSVSLADVAYDGPVIPQSVAVSELDSLPYAVMAENPFVVMDATDLNNSIHSVSITLEYYSNAWLESFATELSIPEVALSQLTISYTSVGSGLYAPHLLCDGIEITPSGANTVTSNVRLTLETTGPSLMNTTKTMVRTAGADRMIAIGLNAQQWSEEALLRQQQKVNAASRNRINGDSYSDDDLIGGFLALALQKYYLEQNQAGSFVIGLTGAVPFVDRIGFGVTSGQTNVHETPGLPVPFIPEGAYIDLPNASLVGRAYNRNSVLVNEVGRSTEAKTDVETWMRYFLVGHDSSALEHAVWQTVGSMESVSTMKSLQLANEDPNNSIIVVEPGDYADETALKAALDLADADEGAIWDHLENGWTVTTPQNLPSPNEWGGVGYLAIGSTGIGWMISGGTYGGIPIADPYYNFSSNCTYESQSSYSPTTVGDPISLVNGSVYHDETDVIIPNLGVPLAFSRHYSSWNTGFRDVNQDWNAEDGLGMGQGWSFSYCDYLHVVTVADPRYSEYTVGDLVWFTAEGSRFRFKADGSDFITPDGLFGTLKATAGGYLWTDKAGQEYEFNASGYLVRIADRFGNGVEIVRNGSEISEVRDIRDASRGLVFTYTDGLITAVSDFTGRIWNYEYENQNGHRRLMQATAPSDASTPEANVAYTYYTDTALDGLLHEVIQPDGGETTYEYYANRYGFMVTDAEGYSHHLFYNPYRHSTEFTNERGNTSVYRYNEDGNLVETRHPDGAVETQQWQNNLLLAKTDAFGQTETFEYDGTVVDDEYDGNGNVVKHTAVDGTVTEFEYSNIYAGDITRQIVNSDETAATLDDEQITQYVYDLTSVAGGDDDDRTLDQIKVLADDGVTWQMTSNTYLPNGLVESTTTPLGNETPGIDDDYTTTFTYNAAGQVESQTSWISENETATTQAGYDAAGNQEWVENANGIRTYYEYDLHGRRLRTILPDPDGGDGDPTNNATVVSHYDAMGQLFESWNALGLATTYEYDGMQRVVRTWYADGTCVSAVYDGVGNAIYEVDELGRKVQNIYDERDRPVVRILPDGSMLNTSYNGGSRTAATTDPLGNTTMWTYDIMGRVHTQTLPDPDGEGPLSAPSSTYAYDGLGRVVSVTDHLGRVTTYGYDRMGRKTLEILPDPAGDDGDDGNNPTIEYQYDAAGNMRRVVDANGNSTRYVYDAAGRVRYTMDALGTWTDDGDGMLEADEAETGTHVSRKVYDRVGNVTSVTDANGNTTEYEYDTLGRMVKQTSPEVEIEGVLTALETVYQYDAAGHLLAVTDPRGASSFRDGDFTTWYFYDVRGRQVAVMDALGTAAEMDAEGIPSAPDAQHSTWTKYDAIGNAVAMVDALGYTTRCVYDDRDMLVKTILPQVQDADGAWIQPTAEQGYDADGQVVWSQDALGNRTHYVYDAIGRQTYMMDALGTWTDENSDNVLDLAEINTATHVTQTVYDERGNVVAVTDARGTATPSEAYDYTTWFFYDDLGRQTAVTGALSDAADLAIAAAADGDGDGIPDAPLEGHSAFMVYDAAGNVIRMEDALSNRSYFVYDALGRQTHGMDALGTWTDTSNIGFLDADEVGTADHVVITQYDALGNITSSTDILGNTTEYRYDALGRLEEVEDASGSVTRTAYDAAGNVVSSVDARGAGTPDDDGDFTIRHEYDALNRKVRQILPDTTAADGDDGNGANDPTIRYEYDAVGNLVSVTDPRGIATIDESGDYRTEYEYDALGRKVSEILPAVVNAETGAVEHGEITYGCDLNGNVRWVEDALGNRTHYVYDAVGRQMYAMDALGTWTDQDGDSVLDSAEVSAATHVTRTDYDLVGNIQAVTDALGNMASYAYDARNRITTETLPTVFDPAGNATTSTTHYGYDPAGRLLYVEDALGNRTYSFYDALGRQTCVTDALGSPTDSDSDGIVDTPDLAHSTVMAYDDAGNVVAITDARGATTSNLYDYTTWYFYDELGRQIAVMDAVADPAGSGNRLRLAGH